MKGVVIVKGTIRRILGIFLCIAMLAGSFLPPLGAMAEEPAAPEGFERWTPYVSGKIWENVSNITATESDWAGAFENTHENGFTDNEGMIGHGWNGNDSGMIYSKERYTDFEMTFDYRSPGWDNIYIGIGASAPGSTFSNQDTGLYSLLIGCKGNVNLRNKTGSTDNWISGDLYNQDPELENFKKLKHSMKIRVVNKKITVYIRESEDGDWNERGTADLAEYNGGYIYLASYTWGGRFAAPVVEKKEVAPAGFENWTPYYASVEGSIWDHIKEITAEKSDWAGAFEQHENSFTDNEGMINHKFTGNDCGMIYSKESYTDFEMTFDYRSPDWDNIYIGIGASAPGNTFSNQDTGLYLLTLGCKGHVNLTNKTGSIDNWISGDLYSQDPELANFRKLKHAMKIRVVNKKITVYIRESEDGDWNERGTVDLQDYNGGYIYLASYTQGGRFVAPAVKDMGVSAAFADFTPYNVDCGDGFFGGTNSVKMDNYDSWVIWPEIENQESLMTSYPWQGGTKAGYMFSNETYENFELTMQYYVTTSWNKFWLGIGSPEQGKTPTESDGNGMTVFHFNSYGVVEARTDGTVKNENGSWTYTDDTQYEIHTVKLVVNKGHATVYLLNPTQPDQEPKRLEFDLGENYKGGYIYLKSWAPEARFSAPKIESLNNELPRFSSYYSKNITYGSEAAVELTEADPLQYWTEKNGKITRKDVPAEGDVCDDLYMAELFLKEQTYKDFELNVDVKRGTSGWQRAFVGFGAELGRHLQQSGGGTTVYLDHDDLRYGGWDERKDEYREGDWGQKYSGIGENDTFHLRIVVQDMEATVYVGDSDKPTSFGLQGSYRGGYIFLASNSTGTTFSNLTVKELSDSGTDSAFDRFACYYSDHIAFDSENAQDLQKTNPKNFWRSEDGKIIRKKTQNGDIRDHGLISELFLKERTYENFELNVDIARGTNGWRRAFVGFGAELGRHFQQSGGGTMVYLDHEVLRYGGWDDENNTYREGDWGLSYDGIGEDDIFHLRLLVMGGVAYVYVNNSAEPTKFAISENYRGGYIYLASNASDTTYANLTVEEIPEGVFNNFSDFSSYYTDRVSGEALVSADPAQYWTELDGVITRKKQNMGENQEHGNWDECSYHLDKMAYLFLNGAYTEHENYQIELDYRGGTGAWARAYMGFGAGKTSTWREKDGGTVFFADGSGNTIFEGNLYRNGTIEKNVSGKQLENYKDGERHHLKLVCRGGIYRIYVDDVEVKTLVVNKYNQGSRFFLATNSSGTEFANIKVTILPDDSAGFGGYDEWYSPNISTTPLTDVKEGTNWSIVDGVITRKAIDLDAQEVEESKLYDVDVAYLYLTDKTYTNFKVELDYKHGNTGWRRSPIGFGAEIGKSFLDKDGGITCFSQPEGIVQITGNIRFNGTFGESVTWATYDKNGKDISTLKPYDREGWHHMVMEVEGGYVTVIIDGFSYHYELSLPGHYKGGYLYLTSNSAASQYRNITIEDYSERDQEDSGWNPKQEDTEFDFGWRKKEDTDSIWKWLYRKIVWRKN